MPLVPSWHLRDAKPHQLSFQDLQKPAPPEGVPQAVFDLWYDNFNYPTDRKPDADDIYNMFVGDWPSLEAFLKDRFEMEFEWWMEMGMDQEEGDFPFAGPDDELFFDSLMNQGLCLVEDPHGRHEGVFVFDMNS
jgi:hypothetical protein